MKLHQLLIVGTHCAAVPNRKCKIDFCTDIPDCLDIVAKLLHTGRDQTAERSFFYIASDDL